MSLFSHLPQAESSDALSLRIGFAPQKQIHPTILELGLQFTDGTITGGNARCLALLQAFKQLLTDYTCPRDAVFHRDLDSYLKPQIQYLVDCRPLAIGMRNAINFVKAQVAATVDRVIPLLIPRLKKRPRSSCWTRFRITFGLELRWPFRALWSTLCRRFDTVTLC